MDPVYDGQSFDEGKRYLKEVLDKLRGWNDVAPQIQDLHDQFEWQHQVVADCPPEAAPLIQLGDGPKESLAYVKQMIPMPPAFDRGTLVNTMAVTASGSNTTFGQLTTIAHCGNPNVASFAQVKIASYRELQTAQDRPREVRSLIARFSANLSERFERALEAAGKAKIQFENESAAAGAIRTLLDGVLGEIFEKARSHAKENMTWDEMARRLGRDDTARATLTKEGARYSTLKAQLSDVLKDRKQNAPIADLWTQVLDHLFTILTLAV